MKKVLLLIVLVLLLTGCTAKYELTYKKGVFTEEITIYEDKEIAEIEELPSITRIDTKANELNIKDDEYYTLERATEDKYNVLKATYKYDKLSLENSLVYQECFSEKSFVDGKNSIYIKLGGDVTCEYLENATITFKTDKKVIKSNADKKDSRKGVYSWDKIPEDGIVLEVSKKNAKGDGNLISPIIRIVITVLLLGAGIYVLKRFNGVEE